MPFIDPAHWVEAGGVIAFASAVWWELRIQRGQRQTDETARAKKQAEDEAARVARDVQMMAMLGAVRETLAAILALVQRGQHKRLTTSPGGVRVRDDK